MDLQYLRVPKPSPKSQNYYFVSGVYIIGRRVINFVDFKEARHNTNQNMSRILDVILDLAKEGTLPRERLILQVSCLVFVFSCLH